ncbi:MAG: hypothetical protein AB1938_32090 [Myxococcota bacterium]
MSDELVKPEGEAPPPPAPSAPSAPSAPASAEAAPALEAVGPAQQVKSGLSWFNIIAVLSVLNSVLIMTKASIIFPVGMGVTQVFAGVGAVLSEKGSSVWNVLAFVGTLVAASCVFVVGRLARAGHRWAWLVGMVAYGLDGLLLVPFGDWIGVGFHVWAIFSIGRGYAALKHLPLQAQA